MNSRNSLPWPYILTIDCTNAVWKNAGAQATTTREIIIIKGDIKLTSLSQGDNPIPSKGDNPAYSID